MNFTIRNLLIFMKLIVIYNLYAGAQYTNISKRQLIPLYKWTHFDMIFPNDEVEQFQLNKGYIKSKVLPVDVDIEYGDDGYRRTFLTFPRLNVGVPYSLATISIADNSKVLNPRVEAYPNYSWHSSFGYNCSSITSAIRTYIDNCWRLWVIDSGQINSVQMCPPQLLAFDLVTDTLIYRNIFDVNIYIPGLSVFTSLTVDVNNTDELDDCINTMVYITDTWGYGLIVFDIANNNAWRIEHEFMRPDKDLQLVNLALDGIFTVNISPQIIPYSERLLYFHSLNSYKEISVPLHIINNAALWHTNQTTENIKEQFKIIGDRGVQCESEIIDSEGNLYCSLLNVNAITKWSRNSSYNSDNLHVVAYDPEQFKFITGLKITKSPKGNEELWALSQEPLNFISGLSNMDKIRFQLLGCSIDTLVSNANCSIYQI